MISAEAARDERRGPTRPAVYGGSQRTEHAPGDGRPAVELNGRTAAVVGAGTIGVSWATLFAAHGMQVRVTDPREDAEQVVQASVRQFAATLPGGPRDADELLARVQVTGLEQAVDGADVVQENGPERIDLKRALWRDVEQGAPAHALLLSSTSGLMPTDMAADMQEPGRLLVGHPFNPPHVVPLIEVVPGAADDARAGRGGGGLLPLARQGAGRAAQGDRRLRRQPAAVGAVQGERPPGAVRRGHARRSSTRSSPSRSASAGRPWPVRELLARRRPRRHPAPARAPRPGHGSAAGRTSASPS